MAKEWTAGDILKISGAYWQTCALQAGVILDVFTALDNAHANGNGADVAALARTLSCNERALDMLVTALVALGFLERAPLGLMLPDHSRKFLSRNSEQYIGFIIKHHAHLMPGWSKLAQAVQTGAPMRSVSSSVTENEVEREAFLMGMFNVAVNQAENIAASLDFSGRNRLLDLGGGPGTYAVYFCLANPGMCATIFDRPTTETFARNIVQRYGLEDRVGFAGGDFLTDPLPEGFDVAWLSQVLHGDAPQDAATLVAKAAKTLNPGGLLVIQEFIVNDDKCGPAHSALFGLNMLVGTAGGQAYTQSAIEAMMRAAGAATVRRLDVALPMGCGILIGTMPE